MMIFSPLGPSREKNTFGFRIDRDCLHPDYLAPLNRINHQIIVAPCRDDQISIKNYLLDIGRLAYFVLLGEGESIEGVEDDLAVTAHHNVGLVIVHGD